MLCSIDTSLLASGSRGRMREESNEFNPDNGFFPSSVNRRFESEEEKVSFSLFVFTAIKSNDFVGKKENKK
jgi:hypothetical protein